MNNKLEENTHHVISQERTFALKSSCKPQKAVKISEARPLRCGWNYDIFSLWPLKKKINFFKF